MRTNTARIDGICESAPVIPVLTLENPEQALGICSALVKGGLNVLEITLRSEYGLSAINAEIFYWRKQLLGTLET